MKPGLVMLAVLIMVGATSSAHGAPSVSIQHSAATTVVRIKIRHAPCACLAHGLAYRHAVTARHRHRLAFRYVRLRHDDYWTYTPPWLTSVAAAPYE